MTGTRVRRRAAGIMVGALAALAMGGCGAGGGAKPEGAASQIGHPGGRLTVLQDGDVDSLDPGITYDVGGEAVIDATQRRLYRWPDGANVGEEQPDLATALPVISDGGRTVTIHIRRGVMFGPPVDAEVTSEDVKYAIERGFWQTVDNPYATEYFNDIVGAPQAPTKTLPEIRGIDTPDRFTLVLHLTQPNGAFVGEALVLPISAPVPERYALPFDRHDPSTYGHHVVATGPYMVANDDHGDLTGYKPDVSILLIRNPEWRRATDIRHAYLDSILIKETASDSTLASREALDGRAIASFDVVPPSVLQPALARTPHQLYDVASPGWDTVPMDTRTPPLNQLDVRRAIVAAFNRVGFDTISGGPIGAGPVQTHYLAPGVPGYQQAGGAKGPQYDFTDHLSGDLALAHAYLVKAGYPSGEVHATLDIVTINDPLYVRQAQYVAAQLAPLGLTLPIRAVNGSEFEHLCFTPAVQPPFCPDGGYTDFADGEAQLQGGFDGNEIHRTNNYNYSQLNDPVINAAMARADVMPLGPGRAAAWGRIDDMITADAPAIPNYYIDSPFAVSEDVVPATNPYVGYDYANTSLR